MDTFDLGEELFNGVEVGAVGRQEYHPRARMTDRLTHRLRGSLHIGAKTPIKNDPVCEDWSNLMSLEFQC